MKKLLLFLLITVSLNLFSQSNGGRTKVRGYTKKDGTHVESYERTKQNNTKKDNWSSKPNRNPNTGKKGYKNTK